MKKISIIGGGSWGTAIAQVIASNGHQVLIKVRDSQQKYNINNSNENIKYFPGIKLSSNIKATIDLSEAVSFADIIFLAVPTYVSRDVMTKVADIIKKDQLLVSTAKGIEEDSYLRNSEIIKEYVENPVAILSGPTHAEEVINNLPTAAVIASKNKLAAKTIQELMMSSKFRVYTNPDIIGVELGGAIKNIMAIAAGIADGLGYGDNTKAALVTRGLHEMSRLGVSMGGSLLTYAGLTGMGDLVVTCTSVHSRNRRLGIKIGEGLDLNTALNEIKQTVEGIRTTKAIYKWFNDGNYDFDIPITKQIYQVLFMDKDPLKAVDDLMLRGAKHEIAEVVEALNW
ncbi:NAD(P)H-dependent glycerol-3-phosphate dehydrogenase [Natronospora cellulosivora (SeqCode)]